MRRVLMVGLLVAALYFFGGATVNVATDLATRGRQLSRSTMGADGAIVETPHDLIAQATRTLGRNVDADAYHLARMLRSEGGRTSERARTALAYVALNDWRAHPSWSLRFTLLYDRDDRGGAKYGDQRGGRYSTSRDPFEKDLEIAESCLHGEAIDETNGATKFVHQNAFGVQRGTRTFAAVASEWSAEGLAPFTVPGTGDLVLFTKRDLDMVG